MERRPFVVGEGGYNLIQETHPQTLAYGLHKTPVRRRSRWSPPPNTPVPPSGQS